MIDLHGGEAGSAPAVGGTSGDGAGARVLAGPEPAAADVDDHLVVDVDHVTFAHAGEDELVLLIGPSGSGKSTATLLLNGIIPHTVIGTLEGAVRVFGMDTRTTPVAH